MLIPLITTKSPEIPKKTMEGNTFTVQVYVRLIIVGATTLLKDCNKLNAPISSPVRRASTCLVSDASVLAKPIEPIAAIAPEIVKRMPLGARE